MRRMGGSAARLLLGALLTALSDPAAAQPFALEPVANVPNPIFATHAGDARLFVADRSGRIWIWTEAGGVAATPFLDIRNKVSTAGEGGFLSMAFHPDYAANGLFYVSYTAPAPFRSVLERYQVSADPALANPASAATLLVLPQPFTNHNGGQLQFGPDGFLYAAFGDGGSGGDPFCLAQRDDDFFGTLLRLDVDQNVATPPFYGIPPGNPFAAAGDGIADEIWASGLRNPWRFSFDRLTGDLFIGDVGQGAREEVDRQPAASPGGEDYGWRVMEGTLCFDANPGADPDCPPGLPGCFDPSYTAPIFEYGRDQGDRSVTGGYVYRGRAIPSLRGRYVFGDFVSGRIWSLEETSPGSWTRGLLLESGRGVASFGEDLAGELYVMDLFGGQLLRLRSASPVGDAVNARCVDTLNAGFAKLAASTGVLLRRCLADAARGALSDPVEACLGVDPRGRLARVRAKTRAREARVCAQTPAFGPFDAEVVSDAAAGLAPDWAHDVFGPDLAAAALAEATDRSGAGCQQAALAALLRCEKARLLAFNRCKKQGLRDGSIDSADDLAACLDADPRGRIARLCDPADGSLARRVLTRRCANRGVPLDAAFPGCAASDLASTASCLDRSQRCRLCLALSAADELAPDCDLHDDAVANASCP